FYIHTDAYPEGAANYFYNMHHCKNPRTGFAGRFFRTNANAEFTTCHETHTDTEFRYTLNRQGELKAYKKRTIDNQWDIFYQGTWYHFVNTYLKKSTHLHLFKFSENLQSETIMTIREAKKWVKAFTNKVNDSEYTDQNVQTIQAQIDEILTQKKRGATT
ncbi:MAG TPA: hypothetical protein VGU44_04450, partial [Gammaproteobacteria bacterium]|nr:hypothetical protein [Gammaproteobacteria bacterium]